MIISSKGVILNLKFQPHVLSQNDFLKITVHVQGVTGVKIIETKLMVMGASENMAIIHRFIA